MLLYSHLTASEPAQVQFIPYTTNATVSLVGPENRNNSNGGRGVYFGLVHSQVWVGGFDNRRWGNGYGIVGPYVLDIYRVSATGEFVKLAYSVVSPYTLSSTNVMFVDNKICYVTKDDKFNTLNLLTGETSSIDFDKSYSAAGGSLYLGGRVFACFRSLTYARFIDITDDQPRVSAHTFYGSGLACKGDLLSYCTGNQATFTLYVQQLMLDANSDVVFAPQTASMAFPGAMFSQSTFSADETDAVLIMMGYVTLNRGDFSLTKTQRPTVGIYPTFLMNEYGLNTVYWSVENNIAINGYCYYNEGHNHAAPIAGISVCDTANGTNKVVSSNWAHAQSLVTDTIPIVLSNGMVVSLHHQANTFLNGKVTQIGYVDIDEPSSVADLVSRQDADWWFEPATTCTPSHSQIALTRHATSVFELRDRVGACVQLAKSNHLHSSDVLRFYELSDEYDSVAQAVISWLGPSYFSAVTDAHVKYASVYDIATVPSWGIALGGDNTANTTVFFAHMLENVATGDYVPSAGYYQVPIPSDSFLAAARHCVNAVTRQDFLADWENRNTKNFVEVELLQIYPTPNIRYTVYLNGLPMATYNMLAGYPDTLNEDGSVIANSADYAVRLLVGMAYSTRELFVECLTGTLDLRQ